MEFTWVTLFWRSGAVMLGLIGCYFAFRIYQLTKKGSNGWFYLALQGLFLFLWAATAMLFSMLDLPTARYISGIVLLLSIAISVAITYTKFVEDFGIKKPRWLNVTTTFSVLMVAFVLLVIGNLLTDNFDEPLVTVLSISHLTLGIAGLIAIIPTVILVRATKQTPWKLALGYAIIIGLGLNIGQYYDNCCYEGGELSESELCSDYDLDYIKVYNLPCYEGLVAIGQYYQISLLIGMIILPTALYQLTDRLRF